MSETQYINHRELGQGVLISVADSNRFHAALEATLRSGSVEPHNRERLKQLLHVLDNGAAYYNSGWRLNK